MSSIATATIEVDINNRPVPVFSSTVEESIILKVIISIKFINWTKQIDPEFNIKSIEIQSVDMFGPNVGFIKFKADAYFNGKPVPSIVFMRGASVAILLILKYNGDKYLLLTKQPRFPIGKTGFLEIPAGMMDENGNFLGVAAKELEEETKIKLKESDLISLGGEVYPSPGGCDEYINYYYNIQEVNEERFNELQGAATGNFEENEQITLTIIPYEDGVLLQDSKAIIALQRYENLAK